MSLFLKKIIFVICIGAFFMPNSASAKQLFYQGQFSEAELVQLLQGKQDKIDKLEKIVNGLELKRLPFRALFSF